MPYVFSFCSSWFGPGTRRPWLVKAKAVALLWWPGSNSGDARWFHEKFVNFAPQMKWRLVGWLDTLGRTVLPMGAAAVKVAKSTVMSEGARSRSQGKWAIALPPYSLRPKVQFFFSSLLWVSYLNFELGLYMIRMMHFLSNFILYCLRQNSLFSSEIISFIQA